MQGGGQARHAGIALALLTCAAFGCALAGCAAAPAANSAPAQAPAQDNATASMAALDQRISELEAAIGRDRAELRRLVSDGEPAVPLRDSAELREIASRLPVLQGELSHLRRLRAAPRPPEPAPEPAAE